MLQNAFAMLDIRVQMAVNVLHAQQEHTRKKLDLLTANFASLEATALAQPLLAHLAHFERFPREDHEHLRIALARLALQGQTAVTNVWSVLEVSSSRSQGALCACNAYKESTPIKQACHDVIRVLRCSRRHPGAPP